MLSKSLGPDAAVETDPRALVIRLEPGVLTPAGRAAFRDRLDRLADQTRREIERRASYGMHARASYRPNDPGRPTVCLIHGINSSSGGFVHMFAPLEAAGFGIVVYDYPYNRSLEESCAQFRRDWAAFRREAGEKRPWAVVAHSMGALLARSYVEDPGTYAGDVSSLILIAPVVHGSSLAKAQTVMQLLNGVQAVNGKKSADALAQLADGLGEAAADISPGSRLPEGAERPAAAEGCRVPHPRGRRRRPHARPRGGKSRSESKSLNRDRRFARRAGPVRHVRLLGAARRAEPRDRRRLRLGRADRSSTA